MSLASSANSSNDGWSALVAETNRLIACKAKDWGVDLQTASDIIRKEALGLDTSKEKKQFGAVV